ncbi:MAG: TIGR00269 family protein, partial [Tepidiformaceae bacterium]
MGAAGAGAAMGTSSRCACGRPAVTFIRYSGTHQCGACLTRSVEERVHGEVRRQADLVPGSRLAVAVSGGKDSLVALHALAHMAAGRRGVEVLAITVDEGIAGYRPPSVEAAARACAALGVEHRVAALSKQDLVTVGAIAALERDQAPCSFCGVLRRRLANAE